MPPVAERPSMAAYGVPDSPEGLLPWSWAEARLGASHNYWVATADGHGRPHALPVWGVWLADRERFWFSCAPDARKARNLRVNPRIVIAPSDSVEVVSVEGRAVETTTAGSLDDEIGAYVAKYGAEMGMEPAAIGDFLRANASFAVVPERAFGIIEHDDEFSRRATRWRWPAG